MKTEKELYKAALDKWGVNSQLMMFFEEMGELITAVCKFDRDNVKNKVIAEQKIIDEIADVEIMLGQLKEFLHCWERVKEAKKNKLNRLEKRIKER